MGEKPTYVYVVKNQFWDLPEIYSTEEKAFARVRSLWVDMTLPENERTASVSWIPLDPR